MATQSIKTFLLTRKACGYGIIGMSKRSMSGGPKPWTYLWQPGPYPETEEGMIIARIIAWGKGVSN